MTLASYEQHGTAGFLPGARSRQMRTVVLAGALIMFILIARRSGLFRGHYESGFTTINPDKVPLPSHNTSDDMPHAPIPIALPGDTFYLTDALHKALHPAPPPTEPPPPPPPFPDSAAVIMESNPSTVPNLVPLILHFANLLGPTWPIVLVTLRANWIEPPSPAFRRLMRSQQIRIVFLPEDTSLASHDAVSVFLTTPWLWDHVASADRVLMFQADSVLCANSAARVEDFAEWDLIGAPIAAQYGVGFNGGLSLRNPRAMLDVIAASEKRGPVGGVRSFAEGLTAHQAEIARVRETEGEEAAKQANLKVPSYEKFEDQWFWSRLKALNGEGEGEGERFKLPSVEVARRFAVETVWEEQPLGYHQPFRWMTEEQKKKALAWCPELAMLEGGSHFF